jgi:pyruvate kinase
MNDPIQALVTAPPYADYLVEVAAHPLVCGLRLNTVMPLRESPAELLRRLSGLDQPLWVDLKGRQLRVVAAAQPPFTEITLSHKIRVPTPVEAFFNDGRERVRVMAVDGDRLILEDGPRRLVGPGESVNIPHPELEIEGTLTESDRAYLAAMRETGQFRVMLSYVENDSDIKEVRELLPDAELLLKIETRRGLEFVRQFGFSHGGLVAARGDLYIEVERPHHIIPALKTIISADPGAVAASRLLESMAYDPVPASADIGDVAFLLEIGYRRFLLGDIVCLNRETLLESLNLLGAIAAEYER